MADKEAEFSKNAGEIEIEIVIGQNKTGKVNFVLFDKQGVNLEHGSGNKSVNKFDLVSALSDLDGALLTWDAIINGKNKPGQKWSVTMTIRQGGQVIKGGVIPNSDPPTFKLVHLMDDKVRLIANED